MKGMAPFDINLCIDLDCIVQGSLTALVQEFEFTGLPFAGCGDKHYPWVWQPANGTKHRPIMAGFTLHRKDSVVVREWVDMMTSWTHAMRIDGMYTRGEATDWQPVRQLAMIAGPCGVFRDDMQALAQVYRTGHPLVWEMPAKTQWFRLDGGEPDGYLVAHYTGGEGKQMLRARFGLKGSE
jgi:hypothetical protein